MVNMTNGILKFWAEWCQPCKVLAPRAEAVAEKLGVNLVSLDIDSKDGSTEAAKYGIRSIPAMVAFKDGKPIDIMVGAKSTQELEEFFSKTI